MALMSMVLVAPAQKTMPPMSGKKMPPAHAMMQGKKLGLKKSMPMRDPKTGRFMKKAAGPLRDPKTGRFMSTHKKSMMKSMGKKPSMKKG
jgi:hypothetical protein